MGTLTYLSQHHRCEHGLQVGEVVLAQLGHDAGVQQHQLQRTRLRPDADHHCVPQVGERGLTRVSAGTRRRPGELDQNVPRMEIPVDKVIHKNLEEKTKIRTPLRQKLTHITRKSGLVMCLTIFSKVSTPILAILSFSF